MKWNSDEELENSLQIALRRTDAPPDFAAKVLAVTRQPARPASRRTFTLALAAGLMAAAVIPALVLDRQHRQEVRGLKARQDLLTALAITRDQLQHARNEIRKNTRTIQ
jgi:hypothetical protein